MSDPFFIFKLGVGVKLTKEQVEDCLDEIERLRELLADEIAERERIRKERDEINQRAVRRAIEHNDELERLRAADSAKSKYIKELRADLAVAKSLARAQGEKTVVAKKRIEELEERHKHEIDHMVGVQKCPAHHITTDQISKAWALVRYYTQGTSNQDNHRMAAVVEGVLAELGIVRCEGCGGDGHSMSTFSAKHEQVRMGTCPDCAEWGSEGWVIDAKV